MKLYCYTEAKDVVEIEMTLEEVVAAGIDPWRLDLCDLHPVVRDSEKGKLHFSRLRDISWAYRMRNGKVYVCSIDGDTRICLEGNETERTGLRLRLSDVRTSEKPFDEHLVEFLEWLKLNPAKLKDTSLIIDQDIRIIAFAPCPLDAVKIHPGGLTFEGHRSPEISGKLFFGNMFLPVKQAIKMPKSIKSVFKMFTPWTPMVFGHPLRRLLKGKMVDAVHLCTHAPNLDTIKAAVIRAGGEVVDEVGVNNGDLLRYNLSNCQFSVWNRRSKLDEWIEQLRWLHSVDGIFALSPDLVEGPLIAFHDLGIKRARHLIRVNADNPVHATPIFRYRMGKIHDMLEASLKKGGYELIAHPPKIGKVSK